MSMSVAKTECPAFVRRSVTCRPIPLAQPVIKKFCRFAMLSQGPLLRGAPNSCSTKEKASLKKRSCTKRHPIPNHRPSAEIDIPPAKAARSTSNASSHQARLQLARYHITDSAQWTPPPDYLNASSQLPFSKYLYLFQD